MRYRGPSTNRPAASGHGAVIPDKCPISRVQCFNSSTMTACPRFARLRSSGGEVVCLDDPSGGPALGEVLNVLEEEDRRS